MDYQEKIIGDIETHSVEGIEECFTKGVSPNDYFNGQPLIYELTSEYMRSPKFKKCVAAFVAHGLKFEDDILLTVLLDDASALEHFVTRQPEVVHYTYTLRCAFTPLYEATLLHICAEFNHVNCAQVLVEHGANVNAKAGTDENGFGGQTPVFHTVNQVMDASADMLEYLITKSADLTATVAGLIWGKGYEWETLIPAVNPISYAMMGLLPQMHRNELYISKRVSQLLSAAYGIDYTPTNVPNKYLSKS